MLRAEADTSVILRVPVDCGGRGRGRGGGRTDGIDIASRRSEQVEHSHSLPATTHLTPSSLFAMDPPPFVVARAKRTWRVGPL